MSMKTYLSSAALLALSAAILPAIPVYIAGSCKNTANSQPSPAVSSEISAMPSEAEEISYSAEPYHVLDVSTGEILEVTVRDYVIGAVCAEMPASFEPEALKAQAVAAHTYAERQRGLEKRSPDPELLGADFSNDTAKYQGYFTVEQAKSYFGSNFDANYKKISEAADEVMPYIITYEDEPIISAFHSMSPGKTESAENAWGAPVDYLIPVDSPDDTNAPKYLDEVRYDKDVLKYKLEEAFPGIVLSDDMEEWITVGEVSDSGTVLTAQTGDRTVTGNDLRNALLLRSACFTVRFEDDQAVFTTRGFGHGVGMSQYGANAMARSGADWKEIISHYYPGCSVTSL